MANRETAFHIDVDPRCPDCNGVGRIVEPQQRDSDGVAFIPRPSPRCRACGGSGIVPGWEEVALLAGYRVGVVKTGRQ